MYLYILDKELKNKKHGKIFRRFFRFILKNMRCPVQTI